MSERPPNSNEELDALAHIVARSYVERERARTMLHKINPESTRGWKLRRDEAIAMVDLMAAASEYVDYEAGLKEHNDKDRG